MKFKNTKTNNIIIAEQEFIDSLQDSFDWVVVEETISQVQSFEETKDSKINELHKAHNKFLEDYKSSYSQPEIESFNDKKKESLAWKIDSNANTPVCYAIAAGRGEDREEFLQSVYDAVMYLTYQEGVMIKARDEIKSCTTEDELNAVEIPKFPAS